MNRMMRPPVRTENVIKNDEYVDLPTRPTDEVVTPPIVDTPITPTYGSTVSAGTPVDVNNKPTCYTKEFTVENSITVKIKDNFYKFQLSETIACSEGVDVETEKSNLINKINDKLDEQIADLVASMH